MAERPTSFSLLDRVARHDQEAWDRLVKLYTPLVYYWCRQGGAQGEDVHDIVQEVFHALSTNLGQFHRDRPGVTFRGWLRGIARHKILDHFKRRSRQPLAEGGSDAFQRIQETPDPLADESEVEGQNELTGLYHRALEMVRSEFEPRSWQAFWRSAVEQQAVVDVAADLGMSEAAVRKAKSRVLRRLKEEVGDLIA
jgi:RNA polymerase sigma-70 factor (ECF subfamily)